MTPATDSFEAVVLDDYQNLVSSLDLQTRTPQVRWTSVGQHLEGAELVKALMLAEAVVLTQGRTAFPASLIDELPALQLLVTTGMSNPGIDLDACVAHHVTVCGTTAVPGTGGEPARGNYAAELAWALILSLARNLPEEITAVRQGRWQHTIGSDLSGATLGIVGLGRIGSAMAPIATAFGMNVIAWSENLDEAGAANAGARLVTKHELFSTADFVTLHLALAESTIGTVGESELRSMKSSAFLINTARAPLIDTDALLSALDQGWIAGAALDVFDTEPLPASSPLRAAPHLIATPHLGYVTHRTLEHWYGEAADDIVAWQHGAPVRRIDAPATSRR